MRTKTPIEMTSSVLTLDALVSSLHGTLFEAIKQLGIPSVTQFSEKIAAIRVAHYLRKYRATSIRLTSFQIKRSPNLVRIFEYGQVSRHLQMLRLLPSSPIRDEIYLRLLDHLFEITITPDDRYPGDPVHDLEQIQAMEKEMPNPEVIADHPDQSPEIPSSACFMGSKTGQTDIHAASSPYIPTHVSALGDISNDQGIVMRIRRDGVEYTLWDLIALFGLSVSDAAAELKISRGKMRAIYSAFGFYHWPGHWGTICNLKTILTLPSSDVTQEIFTRIIQSLIGYSRKHSRGWYRGNKAKDTKTIRDLHKQWTESRFFEQELPEPL